jgi:nitrous oxide reductase accessory protein NosL
MTRVLLCAVLFGLVALAGCGDSQSQPAPVPTDPESIKKLEALQKGAAQGEKR